MRAKDREEKIERGWGGGASKPFFHEGNETYALRVFMTSKGLQFMCPVHKPRLPLQAL